MPSVLRYVTFAEEPTFDVDPAPAAAFGADIESATLDTPGDVETDYGGGLSRSARTHRPGWYSPSGNVVAASDIRTIGWLLKWVLGGYTHTDDTLGSGFHIHELHGADVDELTSFVTRIGKDTFQHRFSGCVLGQLQLATDKDFLRATPDITAARDAAEALETRAGVKALIPAEFPLMFHEVTAAVAASDESAKVRSLQMTINNNLQADAARGLGNRHPRRGVGGDLAVTFQLQVRYEDNAHLERFWGGVGGPAAAGATEFPVQVDVDAGADGSATLLLPRSIFKQQQLQPSGRGELVQSLTGMAYADSVTLADGVTSVDTPILATLNNNQPEMTA